MNKSFRFFKWLGSLQLMLVSLSLMMILVVFGTLAQVRIGTFAAQKEYFSSFFVFSDPFGFRMPVLPGGFLVGGLWLINLVAAFLFQFRFVQKKMGLIVIHAGLILLLLGQFLTQILSVESQMAIDVGHSKNYSEIPREMELVFIMTSDPGFDEVTAIPESRLRDGYSFSVPSLPFEVQIKKVFKNARLMMAQGNFEPLATEGVGKQVVAESIPPVSTDDEANNLTVVLEATHQNKTLGTWLVSAGLGAPQELKVQGQSFSMAVRPRRIYYPFTLHLKEFRHDVYPGTTIPKNFSSLVHLTHHETREDRDVLIYMNNPLRFEGNTFYQASFGKNDTLSIFQVVQNPVWLTPYVACILITLGLAIQFMMHLISFVRKRRL